ncbi:condensin-2 complex subunit D3 [Nematostella vectensis]|uniref:condensin-2 complex subunit D3 n=1 Tax=Nematostella vectensis TaxID=45351 RepID=UPI00207786E1|nr:condensin-2 complex subunit D3 [Nematostella vectensis]
MNLREGWALVVDYRLDELEKERQRDQVFQTQVMSSSSERTLEACSSLELGAIPKEWTDRVWDGDFCESSDLPDVLRENAEGKNWYKKGLVCFLAECRVWSSNSSQDSNAEGFWKVLSDNDISHRSLVAVLHAFVESCDRSTKAGAQLEGCVLAANIYMVLLQLPGSGAYKVFHPLLFQKALDVLKLWPQKGANKRKRPETVQHKEPVMAKQGRPTKTRRTAQPSQPQVNEMDEDSDDEDDDNDDDDHPYHGVVATEAAQQKVKGRMVELLQDVVLLLSTFSLRDADQTRHHVIQLLVELTRLDVTDENMTFSFPPGSQIYNINSLAQVAYIGLGLLITSLHGELVANTRVVFKHLLSNILMAGAGSSPTVPKGIQLIKDKAVKFACFVVGKDCSESMGVVRVLIQHMCTKCPDKAEFRAPVAKSATDLMKLLPLSFYCGLIEWLHKYSKNTKIGYRVFALDLVSQLLTEEDRDIQGGGDTPENCKELTSKKYLLSIVVGRCSDRAPTVRAKALQCLSQCTATSNDSLKSIVKQTLGEALDRNTSAGLNGDCTVGSVIRKRTCDEKVGVRKAALQALESVIHLDLAHLHKPDLIMLHDRCMDPALSVRRQAMVSLTSLLQEQPTNAMLQSIWLDGILPLVLDRETTAQEKCYQILEELILSKIVTLQRSVDVGHVLAWDLLKIVASPSGQEVRRYLQNACYYWSKQGKLTGTLLKALTSHIDSDHNKATWLLLSQMADASSKIDHNFVISRWKEYTTTGSQSCDDETLGWVLSVIGSVSDKLPAEVATAITENLQQKLSGFACTPDVIAAVIGSLCKLCKTQTQAKSMIDSWCTDLLKASEHHLSSVVLESTGHVIDDEMLVKHLFTVGEVAQLAPCRTTERLFLLVESILVSQPNRHHDKPDQELQGDGAPLNQCNLSATVKAHAFVTLGKLCLQNERLAKQCIAALARELEMSEDAAIRNNIVVVMCDLCVRYTSLVDRYIPNIATCLRDKAPLVRRQTLTLLTHLLQEDYVKWKGSLFYHFITALVDEDVEIRKFADFCLVHLLLTRHPGMFHQHFVECIFHFNSYDKHKVFNKFPQSALEKTLFSLKGDINASKRAILYQFLLSHMKDEDRFNLTGKLCQEVLGAITDGAIPLDEDSGSLLKDTLTILNSRGIKLSSMRAKAADEMADEGDDAGAAIVQARNKFLTQVLKKNMIENIIPIIIELKHMFEKHRSPMLGHLMAYLKEVMKDYRDEVQDVLSGDRQLANEIEFDLRKYEEQQKELEEQRQRARNTPQPQPPGSGRRTATPTTPCRSSGQFVTPQLRSPMPGSCPGSPAQNVQVLPKTPAAQSRRHTLASAALIKSARKAMEDARRVSEDRKRKSMLPATGVVDTPARVANEGSFQQGVACTSQRPQQDVARTPLRIRDENAAETESQKETSDADTFKTPVRKTKSRAASTPEGNDSHLSRISFCMNMSAVVPLSPIPSSLPIRIYPTRDKGAVPSWISKPGVTEDGIENQQDVICLPSPEQRLPKPRRWNVKSPETTSRRAAAKPQTQINTDDSVSHRTRSRRTNRK